MPKQLDPLNQLLRHAMHEARIRERVIVKAPTPITQPRVPDPVYQDLYQNPLNWTRGRLITLIHQGPQNRETFLGVFQELLNPKAHVRRLVRDHSPTAHGPALPREYVHGEHWLRAQVWSPPEDSEGEKLAIRERYDELMKEVI